MSFSLNLAWRYLMGRKLRTFLTTLAVIFGVMLVFGLNGLIPAFTESFRKNLMAVAEQVDLTVTSESRGVFATAAVDTVRQVEGVEVAAGSLVRAVTVPSAERLVTRAGAEIQSFTVAGIDPVSGVQVQPLVLDSGRALASGDRQAALISQNLAEQTGIGLGDSLTLPSAQGSTSLEVVGLYIAQVIPGEPERLYVSLETAQAVFNQPGQINAIDVLYAPDADREAVKAEIMQALGPTFKVGGIETGSELLAAIEMGEVVMNLFGVMALIMGGFIILNTFRTLIAERRRDIGMLRALGASRKTVLNLIVAESLVQGVLGTALGLVGGYVLVKAILVLTGPVLTMKFGIPIGEPSFSPLMIATAVILGIGVTLAGGLFPAISASRLTPLDALRPANAHVVVQTNRKRALAGMLIIAVSVVGLVSGDIKLASLGAFGFLVGLTLATPALVYPIVRLFGRLLGPIFAREGQIAEGNLTRQPGRAALTATVVMISLAIVVTMGGVVTTFSSSILGYIDKTLGSDYLMMPGSLLLSGGNVGASPELAADISTVPGVEAVTSLRLSSTQVGDASLQVLGIDPQTYPEVAGLIFSSGDPDDAYAGLAEGRMLIANGIFAAREGTKIGDDLTLQTPNGPQTYRVVALAIDYLNAKLPTVYISQANLEQDFHETSDMLIMVNRANGADDASTYAALESLVDDYPAFSLFSAQALHQDMTEAMSGVFSMIYLLMVVLAAPSLIALINTLAISVLERTREIGMLRAVGATRRQVQRMILAESLLLTGMGTAFGILAGVWLGYVLVEAANATGFVITYNFPFLAIALTIAIGLLFGVLAALIPARQAARLQIVKALQYE